MGIKEKEHEEYFLGKIKDNKLLPFFEKTFAWGTQKSFNDVDAGNIHPVESSAAYCKTDSYSVAKPKEAEETIEA